MRATAWVLALVLAGLAPLASSATPPAPSPGPVIAHHGAAVFLPGAAHRPDPELRQRAVFNLTAAPSSPAAIDPGLDRVARVVNLSAASGLAPAQLDFVVLLSSGATDAALGDAAYRARHGVANPNLGLIAQLSSNGVQLFVCGQALHARKLDGAALAPGMLVSLSALTSVIQLQQQGYALVPL